jgi:hypothetical protein
MFTFLIADFRRVRSQVRLSYWQANLLSSVVTFVAFCWLRDFLPNSNDEFALWFALVLVGLLAATSFVLLWNKGVVPFEKEPFFLCSLPEPSAEPVFKYKVRAKPKLHIVLTEPSEEDLRRCRVGEDA